MLLEARPKRCQTRLLLCIVWHLFRIDRTPAKLTPKLWENRLYGVNSDNSPLEGSRNPNPSLWVLLFIGL